MVKPKPKGKSPKSPGHRGHDDTRSPYKTKLTGASKRNIKFDEIEFESQQSPLQSLKNKIRKTNKSPQLPQGKNKSIDSNSDNNSNSNQIMTRKALNLTEFTTGQLAEKLDVAENRSNKSRKSIPVATSSVQPVEANKSVVSDSEDQIMTETAITTEVAGDDPLDYEDSSEEERQKAKKERVSGRRYVERKFPSEANSEYGNLTIDESQEQMDDGEQDDQLMKEIEDNPRLWGMVQRMVSKASTSTHHEAEPVVKTKPNKRKSAPAAKGRNLFNKSLSPISRKSYSDATMYVPALKQKRITESANSPTYDKLKGSMDSDVLDKISNYLERIRIENSGKGSLDETERDGNEPESPVESDQEESAEQAAAQMELQSMKRPKK